MRRARITIEFDYDTQANYEEFFDMIAESVHDNWDDLNPICSSEIVRGEF